MALIDCPECNAQVSSAAPSCLKCGFPVAEVAEKALHEDSQSVRLERDLQKYEATSGSPRVSDAQVAVLLSQKKQTNHILHLLLSVVTGGVWLIVWFFVAESNSRHNQRIDAQIEAGSGHSIETPQRLRLRQMAKKAAQSRSQARQEWGRETLKRLEHEDE